MSKCVTSGVVLLDKAAHVTSMGAIAQVRKKLNLKKIGHAGTLDPGATGLLICLLNGATRLASFAKSGDKLYTGIITFGVTSNTDDIDGQLEQVAVAVPDLCAIQAASTSLTGSIEQVPPQVSAVKVNGEKAYARARKGLSTDLKARTVQVDSFVVEELEGDAQLPELLPANLCKTSYRYSVKCSAGTYVRSLARDLGEQLGCGAIITELRREESQPFSVKSAKPLERITHDDILPWDVLFPDVTKVPCDSSTVAKIQTGNQEVVSSLGRTFDDNGEGLMVYAHEGSSTPCGLLVRQDHEWKIGLNIPLSGE